MNNSQNKIQLKLYLLEISLFLFNFATALSSSLLINQLLKQSCILFNYEKSLCDMINENNRSTIEIEEQIQPYVADITLIKNFLDAIAPAILQLFLGSWSDKYGRKKVMNIVAIGYVLTYTSVAAVCYYSDNIYPLNPWIYIICFIPMNFFGGFESISTATICYVTDTCEEAKRSSHFIIIEFISVFSFISGALFCPFILVITSSTTVFTIAAVCTIFGLSIVTIFVDESVQIIDDSLSSFKSVLSAKHIVEMIETCFMPRSLYGRSILLSLVTIMAFNKFTSGCWKNVGYLYGREAFNWTLEDFSFLLASNVVIAFLGTLFAMSVFKKFFGFSDIILISFAIFGNFLDFILRTFANQSWQMFAISLISFMELMIHPLCRSIISSIISKHETGKVMSFASSMESLAIVIAPLIFITLYEATYKTFPGAFFILCAAVCFMNLFIVIYVMIVKQIASNIKEKYTEID